MSQLLPEYYVCLDRSQLHISFIMMLSLLRMLSIISMSSFVNTNSVDYVDLHLRRKYTLKSEHI